MSVNAAKENRNTGLSGISRATTPGLDELCLVSLRGSRPVSKPVSRQTGPNQAQTGARPGQSDRLVGPDKTLSITGPKWQGTGFGSWQDHSDPDGRPDKLSTGSLGLMNEPRSALLGQPKRHQLLTWKVSSYCLLALHGRHVQKLSRPDVNDTLNTDTSGRFFGLSVLRICYVQTSYEWVCGFIV